MINFADDKENGLDKDSADEELQEMCRKCGDFADVDGTYDKFLTIRKMMQKA